MFPGLNPHVVVHVPSAPNLHDTQSFTSNAPAHYKRSGSLRLANSWQPSPSSSSSSTPPVRAALHHGASAVDPVAEAMASGAFTLDQVLAFPISWRNMALAMPRSGSSSTVVPPTPSPKLPQVKSEPSSSRAASSSRSASSQSKGKRTVKGSARAARSVMKAAKKSKASSSSSASAVDPSTSNQTFRSRPTLSFRQLPSWTTTRSRRASSIFSASTDAPSLSLSMDMDEMPDLEPSFDQSSQSGNESCPHTPNLEIKQELDLLPLPSIALPDMDMGVPWTPRAQYDALTPLDGPALGLMDGSGLVLNPWKFAEQVKRTPEQPAGWSHDWNWALDETLAW